MRNPAGQKPFLLRSHPDFLLRSADHLLLRSADHFILRNPTNEKMETFISLVIIWLVATWLLASAATALTNQKNQ